ncbi:MAG: Hpt domain-containing protein, partial [Cyanobacteria bacterium J06631_2]
MPLNPDIRDQAYQFFIEEAQELLQVLETGLLDLREDHSTPKVHELMRAAHSIKGGAASVELSAIGLLAHRLEDFFKALYSDDVDFDAELEGLLLQGYDCLSLPLLEQIEAGAFDEEAALLKAEPVFAALEVRLEEALKNADNYIPSSNDLGVDIVSSIFEVDVMQALERLQTVIGDPGNYDPAAELAGTLEMFAGFAELFNLSGFTDIVLTAQAALESNPQNVLAVIKATLTDCTQAAEQVLAGDRERGGAVSLTLIELAQGQTVAENLPEQAIAFEQDIWSTTPDDIFGSVSDEFIQADLTEEENNLWSTAPPEESLADEILEHVAEADIAAELAENVAKVEQINQIFESLAGEQTEESALDVDNIWSHVADQETTVEDIFASVPQENISDIKAGDDNLDQLFDLVEDKAVAETAPTEEILSFDEIAADSDNLWSAIPNSEALVEDIFGTVADESIISANQNQTETDDNLDQLFNLVEDEAVVEAEPEEEVVTFDEIAADSDNLWSAIPNSEPLAENENIFDTVADELTATADIDINTKESKLTAEQEETNSEITAAVDSITNIFDSLPPAQPESLLALTKLKPEPKQNPQP